MSGVCRAASDVERMNKVHVDDSHLKFCADFKDAIVELRTEEQEDKGDEEAHVV